MEIRCVVTGQNASGKSLIIRDKGVQPVSVALLPGYEFHRVWGSDSVVKLPSDGTALSSRATSLLRMASASDSSRCRRRRRRAAERIVTAEAVEEMQEKLPGMMDVLEPDHPGMHTTDTVDFDVVISGEVYLELDDGAEVLLKAGDCVIQNGTRHAWHNRSAEKCVIAVTLVGAERKS